MSVPEPAEGLDAEVISHLFLKAPLPNLPHPHCLFQKEDINSARMKVSHQQLVDCYHTVAEFIETSFGTNAIFSPSAWIRTLLDLITHILQGVLATRNFSPDGEPLEHEDFRKLFNDKDWEAVGLLLVNLEHLSQSSPPQSTMKRTPPSVATASTRWPPKLATA
jgi:hypothetical protein